MQWKYPSNTHQKPKPEHFQYWWSFSFLPTTGTAYGQNKFSCHNKSILPNSFSVLLVERKLRKLRKNVTLISAYNLNRNFNTWNSTSTNVKIFKYFFTLFPGLLYLKHLRRQHCSNSPCYMTAWCQLLGISVISALHLWSASKWKE